MTADIKCPHCGHQAFTDYGDGLIACQGCHAQFDLSRQQCPYCGTLVREGASACLQCGTDLRGDLVQRTIKGSLMTQADRRRERLSEFQQPQDEAEESGLKCPHCGSQAFTDYGDGLVACQRCYVQFDLNQQQCPHCGSLLAKDNYICVQCGTDLRGGLARRMIEERLMTTDDWRRARLAVTQQQRTDAEEMSDQRMQAWWKEEQERRQIEYQKQLARQRRERNVLIITGVVILVIVLILATLGVIFLSSGPSDPTPAVLLFQWGMAG